MPGGVNRAKLGGWVGEARWRAVTAEGRPVRRQMSVDWPALWQYCAQKARTKCTLGMEKVWSRSVAVRLPEIQPFYHSWVLHWALTEPGN